MRKQHTEWILMFLGYFFGGILGRALVAAFGAAECVAVCLVLLGLLAIAWMILGMME